MQIKLTSTRGISLALGLLLTVVLNAHAQSSLTNGLVAYYPFNGSAKDASGFGDNGTNYQAVLASDRHGQTNQAYVFDNGQLNTIETVGANIPRGLGAQTFSIWFKQSPNVVGDFLHAPLFSVWSGQPADKCFRVEFWGDSLQIWDGGAGYYKVFSGPNLPMTDCQWHHLVCVVTTNGISAFFDSRTVLWSTVPPSPTNRWDLPAGSFWIGYEQGAYYDGDLDDVRVYNRALSPAEVLQLYASEAPTTNGMPAIVSQPQSQLVARGNDAQFSVAANGAQPLTYQWRFNGSNLTGQTKGFLWLTKVTADADGDYSVVVSNALGSVTSSVAWLSVILPTPGGSAPTNGLVAHYPFNGNANDASGYGDNGTNYGATLTTDRFGQTNRAFLFNVDQPSTIEAAGVNIPRGLGAKTFSIWFKQSPRIVGDYMHAPLFSFWSGQPADPWFKAEFWGDSLLIWDGGDGYYKAFDSCGTCPSQPMADGQWHHLAFVVTTNDIAAFLDARPVVWSGGLPPPTTEWNLPQGSLWMGYGPGSYFDGALDDVRVYDRALTEAEVQQLYAAETIPLNSPPAIQTQPTGQSVVLGSAVKFTVLAAGESPLSYQWRFNGNPIASATLPSLTISVAQLSSAGSYDVVVSNGFGAITSSTATLNVVLPPSESPAAPTNGLVAYYPFNGNANDQLSISAPGQVLNTTPGVDRFGNSNACYGFNPAAPSAIIFPETVFPRGTQPATMSFWIRQEPRVSGGHAWLLQMGDRSKGTNWNFNLLYDWAVRPVLDFLEGNVYMGNYSRYDLNPGIQQNLLWEQIVLTFNSNSIPRLFVDGQYLAFSVFPPPGSLWSRPSGPLDLGSTFSGFIDDVRVYNRALSDEEVGSLYQSEAPPTAPTITQQPLSLAAAVGTDVAFGVVANGTPPLSFQWRKDGTNISGATSPVFGIASAQVSNRGFYDVVVTNAYGAVTSSMANLLVQSPVVYDDFNDSEINLDLWRVVSTNSAGLLIVETNGRVEMTISATTTNQAGYTDFRAYCEGNSRLRGDFDIQVDYALLTGTNLAGVWVQFRGGWGESVQRQDGRYYAQGTTVPAQDVSGKLRLLRLQGVMQSFYYSGGDWIPIHIGPAVTTNDVPLVISVVSSDSIFKHQETKVAFDNVTINAGELLWGPKATLRTCVVGSSLQGNAPFSSTTAFGYHWQKDGASIAGATNRILTLVNIGLSNSGTYRSVVSNSTTGTITNDVIVLTVRPAVLPAVRAGPFTNPANAHLYYLLNVSSWLEAEQASVALGGHLTTIRNQVENDWIQNNLLELARPNNLWIGLLDPDPLHNSTDQATRRSEFVWIGGEPVLYSNWQVNEPNNAGFSGEFYGAMFSPDFRFSDGNRSPGFWNDEHEGSNQGRGVVEVIPPPGFITQPQSQTVASGSTAVLSAEVWGSQPLTFQWRKAGFDIASATNATLTLNNVQLGDAGAYKLFVSNAVGVATSQGALLTVLEPVTIGGQPHAATVNQGASTNFTVSATGGGTLFYQWRRGGSPVAGATGSSLIIPNAQAADDADYSVVVSNVVSSLTSASAHLLVVLPPVITTQPVSRTNVTGTTASFSVAASGTTPNYQWRKGGANLAGATSATLNLANVTSTNAGNYDVVVWNPAGTNTSLSATLTVLVPAAITASPTNQSILVSNSATFSVTATGTAPLGYQWRKAGLPISGATVDTYAIAIVQTNDAGSYDVVVTNVVGSATSLVGVLTVLYPPSILVQPTNTTTVLDGEATFSVLANGSPSPTYRWMFKGTTLPGRTNATLQLTEVATSDAGTYKVVVENPYGIVTSSGALLTVLSPLTLAEALDAVGYLWTTGGNSPWLPQTNVTSDGVDAAAGGIITDYQQTWVETKFNGPGQLAFQWKVSSEFGFDQLGLALDGLPHSSVSGEMNWTPQTLPVSGGSHTLRWTYAKDGSSAFGQDRSWLDQVSYVPAPGVSQPVYLLQPKVRLRDGLFQFDLLGEPGKTITVELSINLRDWSPLATITNQTGTARFIDPAKIAHPTRFYRVRTP